MVEQKVNDGFVIFFKKNVQGLYLKIILLVQTAERFFFKAREGRERKEGQKGKIVK